MRDTTKCPLYENGNCKKRNIKGRCNPVTADLFQDRFSQCNMDNVCQCCSIYGNDFFFLTDEDIDALKSGKILYCVEEYGVFLVYKEKS